MEETDHITDRLGFDRTAVESWQLPALLVPSITFSTRLIYSESSSSYVIELFFCCPTTTLCTCECSMRRSIHAVSSMSQFCVRLKPIDVLQSVEADTKYPSAHSSAAPLKALTRNSWTSSMSTPCLTAVSRSI